MAQKKAEKSQLNFLLPISNPRADQITKEKRERERFEESRKRLIDDLRRAGL